MTTIAWDGKTLATDSRATNNDISIFLKCKNTNGSETRFTGFGRDMKNGKKGYEPKDIEQSVILSSTRSILELIMPNV